MHEIKIISPLKLQLCYLHLMYGLVVKVRFFVAFIVLIFVEYMFSNEESAVENSLEMPLVF